MQHDSLKNAVKPAAVIAQTLSIDAVFSVSKGSPAQSQVFCVTDNMPAYFNHDENSKCWRLALTWHFAYTLSRTL